MDIALKKFINELNQDQMRDLLFLDEKLIGQLNNTANHMVQAVIDWQDQRRKIFEHTKY